MPGASCRCISSTIADTSENGFCCYIHTGTSACILSLRIAIGMDLTHGADPYLAAKRVSSLGFSEL